MQRRRSLDRKDKTSQLYITLESLIACACALFRCNEGKVEGELKNSHHKTLEQLCIKCPTHSNPLGWVPLIISNTLWRDNFIP